jgi:hopanoid biosynthesis associated protein HpnK
VACRLILNADDLGWSQGVNDAVCDLYDEGIITSTSLMVGAPAAPDAVARVEHRPGLAVGLHLTLVGGPSLLPPQTIPHLVDRRGWFSSNCLQAGLWYTLLSSCHRELRLEAGAQFKALSATGIPWSHADSHMHFSLTPVVFRTMLDLCRQYPVAGIRVPEDDYRLYHRIDPAGAARQRLPALWFRLACGYQRRLLSATPFAVTQRCYGFFRTGRLDIDYLERLVAEMPDGEFELHCHPDLSTEAGRAEYQALRSARFRRALESRRVALSTYRSLRSR